MGVSRKSIGKRCGGKHVALDGVQLPPMAASSGRVYRHGKTNAKVRPGECLGNNKHSCIDWQPSVDKRKIEST
jgi:hypothetical protein